MDEIVVGRLIEVRDEHGKLVETKLVKDHKHSVAVLTPHRTESDYREWRDWLYDLLLFGPDVCFLEARGRGLAVERTRLVKRAMEETDAEYFFFLDDDVIPPSNVLTALLSHQKPIVCGIYWTREPKKCRCPAAYVERGTGPNTRYVPISLERGKRLVEVDYAGLGCALIRRSIFEKLSAPWFEYKIHHGEDFYFFEKVARETGVKPLIDMDVKCRHIGVFSIEPDGSFEALAI